MKTEIDYNEYKSRNKTLLYSHSIQGHTFKRNFFIQVENVGVK